MIRETVISVAENIDIESLNDFLFSPPGIWLLGILVGVALFAKWKQQEQDNRVQVKSPGWNPFETRNDEEFVPDIFPVKNFNLETEEPVRARPYKPKFHLTMGLMKATHNDIVLLDKLYPEHIRLRKRLVEDHPKETYGVHPHAASNIIDVIAETYDMLLGTILPQRWPQVFSCSPEKGFYNSVTGEPAPFPCPRSRGGLDALKILATNVEEDLLIMTGVNGPDGNVVYVLQAFAVCFPSGFFPQIKAGMTVDQIHSPVPGFRKTLGMSMDRFFRKIAPGQVVQRWNWNINLDPSLFQPAGNHFYPTVEVPFPVPLKLEELDPDMANLRVEHQTLSRLPKTKGLIFTIKTYLTSLRDVREEGTGEALAVAIEGMGPERCPLAEYKRRGEWGSAVVEYLRS